jgi:hypothetical protein
LSINVKVTQDIYLVSFHTIFGEILASGRANAINFALAGTYPSMKQLLVHSPCRSHPAFERLLPLRLFSVKEIQMLWEHFWKFPSVSPGDLNLVFEQIQGNTAKAIVF